jgi:four helix bundle protein
MQDFKSLKLWQKAHGLALDIYRTSGQFPSCEIYGLTSQIRRASASIPANIAEGCGRGGNAEFARFLQIASGSASEVEYHLLLARDLGLLEVETHSQLSEKVKEIKRMRLPRPRKFARTKPMPFN